MQKLKKATAEKAEPKAKALKGNQELKLAAAKGKKIAAKKPEVKLRRIFKPKSGMTMEFKTRLIHALDSGKYHKINGAVWQEGNHVCVMGAMGMETGLFGNGKRRRHNEEDIGQMVGIGRGTVGNLVRMNDRDKSRGQTGWSKLAAYINKNL